MVFPSTAGEVMDPNDVEEELEAGDPNDVEEELEAGADETDALVQLWVHISIFFTMLF